MQVNQELKNTNWTLVGKYGTHQYREAFAFAVPFLPVPGIFIPRDQAAELIAQAAAAIPLLESLALAGDGQAAIIYEFTEDLQAVSFHDISDGFGFGGVWAKDQENPADEYSIVDGKMVHGSGISDGMEGI